MKRLGENEFMSEVMEVLKKKKGEGSGYPDTTE